MDASFKACVRRGCRDAWRSLGGVSVLYTVVFIPIVGFGLHYLTAGRPAMMEEVNVWLLYAAMATPIVFVGLFVVNVARAPFRIMREELASRQAALDRFRQVECLADYAARIRRELLDFTRERIDNKPNPHDSMNYASPDVQHGVHFGPGARQNFVIGSGADMEKARLFRNEIDRAIAYEKATKLKYLEIFQGDVKYIIQKAILTGIEFDDDGERAKISVEKDNYALPTDSYLDQTILLRQCELHFRRTPADS